ncbi:peptidoglycan D,D-transpeptidase FtsI family protein [Paenibacillus lutrae]|uniref:Penicillin-binding protein n=1 Tax=Paenibacillus lutrae TaxID=2078573 RepID=A0A7X3FHB1_9BACL|nr:penicillin-binding transpeptidase domain-containing protein [Paenibacillus lutrae]MVO99606.1 penicillin-binding protein [Paenibacillus lutrae]
MRNRPGKQKAVMENDEKSRMFTTMKEQAGAGTDLPGGRLRINASAGDPRRKFFLLLCMTGFIFVLLVRLFWIQLVQPYEFSARKVDLVKNSVLQRQRSIVLDTGRGDIYDRNHVPLTGRTIRTAIIFPVHANYIGTKEQLAGITQALGVGAEEWTEYVRSLQEPALWKGSVNTAAVAPRSKAARTSDLPIELTPQQISLLTASGLPYLQVTDYKVRYFPDQMASQVIGYVGQHPERISGLYAQEVADGHLTLTSEIGASGLEKTFENRLRGIGERTLSIFTDAGRRPLNALHARIISPDQSHYPLRLITTLDADIQQKVEQLMAERGIQEGAVVVLDAVNADIIAMASSPAFRPGEIRMNEGNWANLALKAATPGSIFKTTVAAAALEENLVTPEEKFDCQGAWGKYGFTCWKKEGHGKISFAEGFAQSCNIVFGQVMQRLSSGELENYARSLGLLTSIGWQGKLTDGTAVAQLDGEEEGQLFGKGTPPDDEGVRLQTAIGQRDVQMTPLQAANQIVTLLNNGQVRSPRLVKEIQFRDGLILDKFKEKPLPLQGRMISAETAKELLAEMRLVVEQGTARQLQQAQWALAGKSGTAQVGSGAQETVNQWFTGFGPASSPRYAVAVLVSHTAPEAPSAAVPLFREVMDLLAELGAKKK